MVLPTDMIDPENHTCWVCRMFFTDTREDQMYHRAVHEQLARGRLPVYAREVLQTAGLQVIRGSVGMETIPSPKEAAVLVALAWWHQHHAHHNRSVDHFNEFMYSEIRKLWLEIPAGGAVPEMAGGVFA